MSPDRPGDELLGLVADERLLSAPEAGVPSALSRPPALPAPSRGGGIVGLGATMTGVTLLGGLALAVFGLIDLFDGGGTVAVIALVVGLVLAGTHWGWVHVAEATATGLNRRADAPLLDARQQWLRGVAPFTRYEVITRAGEDGAITIERVRFSPERCGGRTFTFAGEVELSEVHAPEEPAAAISERAELLRREAAADTERERARFQDRADAFERDAIAAEDDREQRAVQAVASRALSDQINANLRDPPLTE
jgi:hypothetical protein